jgi:hypothetical protein
LNVLPEHASRSSQPGFGFIAKHGSVSRMSLQIVSETAGHFAQTTCKFNGKTCGEAKSRLVDFSDPDDCKRNKDGCDVH